MAYVLSPEVEQSSSPLPVMSATRRRRAATELPPDERHSALIALRYRTDRLVRTAARAGVIIPVVLGVGGGLVALFLGAGAPAITDGLIVGGVLSGLFNYGQAIAEATKERRQLQIQLAAGTDLKRADLARIDLSRAYLREKNLEGARLSGAICFEADFSHAKLGDARLTDGLFTRACFDQADMEATGCFEAKLTRCSFVKANLRGASLCGADLRHSDLSRADLRDADLRRANLQGCTLDGAKLEGAWYSPSTTWPADYSPPSDPADDRHRRAFRHDRSEEDLTMPSVESRTD